MSIRLFETELQLTPVIGSAANLWMTTAPLLYRLNPPNQTVVVSTPAGYITDLATIPRWLWSIFPPQDTRYAAASVIHDYLCKSKILPRAKADAVFKEAMLSTGTPAWKAWIMYLAVRVGSLFPARN